MDHPAPKISDCPCPQCGEQSAGLTDAKGVVPLKCYNCTTKPAPQTDAERIAEAPEGTGRPRYLYHEVLPTTEAEALEILRDFKACDMTWHFDDPPEDVVMDIDGEPLFPTWPQCVAIENLVGRLNEIFGAASETPEAINAGAWHAGDLVNWNQNDETGETRQK